jgi:hypothetical protein
MTKLLNNVDVTGYISQTSVSSSLLKTDSNGKLVAAVAGTDYQTPTALASADRMVTVGRNATGATLYKGTIVYISGSTGNRPNFVKAQANVEATSAGTFGVVYADIPNNSDGNVVNIGVIDTLDTRSIATNPFTTDTLADGDTIYLSPTTAGYVTNVKPSAPNHLVYVGKVTRTSPTNGTIVYRIQNGYELDEIHNVAISSVANNQGIFWESATSLWKNKTIATVLGYTPVDASLTTNYIPKATGATSLGNSLIYDSGTKIGINTSTINSAVAQIHTDTDISVIDSESQYALWVSQTSVSKGLILGYSNTFNAGVIAAMHTGVAWKNLILNPFAGNVLIGTSTNSGYKLDVNGTGRFSGSLTTLGDIFITGASKAIVFNSAVSYATQIYESSGALLFNTGSSTRLTLASTGAATFSSSVTAYTSITVSNNGAESSLLGATSNYADGYDAILQLNNTHTGGRTWRLLSTNNSRGTLGGGKLVFQDTTAGSNTAVMTLVTGGNVGIGTTSPSTKFYVSGGDSTFDANGGNANIVLNKSASYDASLYFLTAGAYKWVQSTNGDSLTFNSLVGGLSERMRITSGGNVGIGTTSPATLLHISSSNTVLQIQSTSVANNANLRFVTTARTWTIGPNQYLSDSSFEIVDSTAGSPRIVIPSSGNVLIGTTTDAGYKLDVNGTGRFKSPGLSTFGFDIANNAGNRGAGFYNTGGNNIQLYFYNSAGVEKIVLDGTNGAATFSSSVTATSATATGGFMEIQGSVNAVKTLYVNRYGVASGSQHRLRAENGYFEIASANSEPIVLTGGNVGIGTTSPANYTNYITQTINGTNGAIVQLQSSGTPSLRLIGEGVDSYIDNVSTGALIFRTTGSNATERMRITSGGNVLIGTTTDAGYKLDVNGTSRISGLLTGSAGFYFNTGNRIFKSYSYGTDLTVNTSGGWAQAHRIYNEAAPTQVWFIGAINTTAFIRFGNPASIDPTGFNGVGFGLSSSGAATFDSSVTATSFFESSDKTVKTLIEDNYQAKGIESVVAKLYTKNGKEELGYFAQDVQGILPSAVSKGADGLLSLSYREVHTAKIARLEKRVEELEQLLNLN